MGGPGGAVGAAESRRDQPGPSWPGAADAPRTPGSLPRVDVLTQCGLLRSRQALTKNTFPVRRELPRHVLLFCFRLRIFFAQDLSGKDPQQGPSPCPSPLGWLFNI